jgi:N-methylhydantoinase A/oxoprolinase/acetone carboxylase beta subunit
LHPLTLIAAPAGFGKTTLVSEWIHDLQNHTHNGAAPVNLPVAWLSLEEDDNDIGRFFTYLLAALRLIAATDLGENVVALRALGYGPGAKPELPKEELHGPDVSAARLPDRPVWFNSRGPTSTAGYDRDKLSAGNRFAGPAVVFQFDATTVITPGWQVWVDVSRNLWLWR